MSQSELLRLAAFSDDPDGGNPAGVWIGESLPDPETMQGIATDVGYSETAFLAPSRTGAWIIRYYSPEAEVTFCGHATIASGVALGKRYGTGRFILETIVGNVDVAVRRHGTELHATLFSVEPEHRSIDEQLLSDLLESFGWTRSDLDDSIPTGLAFAGAWHPILPLADRDVLAGMEYDFDALKGIMLAEGLTTIQVVHRRSDTEFDARDPFPVGGVVEDPATGAAAAALGAHLRHHHIVDPPVDFMIHQGDDLGRPSRIGVHIPASGGIEVSGTAVPIPV